MTQPLNLQDAYCLAPWVNVLINYESNIKPCCAWHTEYESIEDYPNEPSINDLKTQLITNNPSELCKNCVEKNWYDEFRNIDPVNDINDFSIQSVDVRWATTCQLSCTYCRPAWSSSWAKLKSKVIPIKNERIKDLSLVYNFFSTYNIQRVSMLGGEPLLLKENLKLLDSVSNDTAIEIFTNLNMDLTNNELYHRLTERSNVNWYVSMENVGDKFEFVRRGASWDQQVQNITHLTSTNAKSVSLQSQYCVYSAFDLFDLYEFSSGHNLHVNLMAHGTFDPHSLNIFLYPREFKMLALQEIDKCLEKFPNSEFKLSPIRSMLINSMDNVDPNIVQDCIKWHNDQETKFFNNKYNFVDLWKQFGEIVI